jgi:putative ABC transport system permease protein
LRHQITDQDDFTISNQADVISTLNVTNDTFTVFLGAIAAISLAVGGIGIMNIMLVSVTERTREIGIRKALGAKRQDILAQFVTEAVLLSLGGGGIGVVGGVLMSRLLDGVELGTQTLRTVFSGDIAILALIVSAGIGLFFGIYPALRAAQMRPIEALRYE